MKIIKNGCRAKTDYKLILFMRRSMYVYSPWKQCAKKLKFKSQNNVSSVASYLYCVEPQFKTIVASTSFLHNTGWVSYAFGRSSSLQSYLCVMVNQSGSLVAEPSRGGCIYGMVVLNSRYASIYCINTGQETIIVSCTGILHHWFTRQSRF